MICANKINHRGKPMLSGAKRTFFAAAGVAAASVLMLGGSLTGSWAQPATVVAPPAVAISREPLELDPSKWVGCHRVTGGTLCAPSIQTGTPEIQAKLRAQMAAAKAAGMATPVPGSPPPPMVCGTPLKPVNGQPVTRVPQGGRGPIRVLFITKGHEFEREQLLGMLDCLGDDITYTHVEHPAADILMNPQNAKNFDVFVFYDLGGPGVVQLGPKGERNRFYPDPSPELKTGFEALLKEGKGMVFLHHAAAAWTHVWPEYAEVVGGACDWYAPVTVRGILDPHHGYYPRTPQHQTVVDKSHPVVQGLGDGFDLTDEAYGCAWFPESVTPILTTSFTPPDPRVNLNPKRQYSNLSTWVKASENSPVFYTQMGHDNNAWRVPAYQTLIRNAIKWAASPEAHAWAKANRTRIFK
jgi:type 1 glutamine amidotransferase